MTKKSPFANLFGGGCANPSAPQCDEPGCDALATFIDYDANHDPTPRCYRHRVCTCRADQSGVEMCERHRQARP